jgi:hypothetical protein
MQRSGPAPVSSVDIRPSIQQTPHDIYGPDHDVHRRLASEVAQRRGRAGYQRPHHLVEFAAHERQSELGVHI